MAQGVEWLEEDGTGVEWLEEDAQVLNELEEDGTGDMVQSVLVSELMPTEDRPDHL